MAAAILMSRDGGTEATAGSSPKAAGASLADGAMDRYATGDERAFETVFDEIAPRLELFFAARVDPMLGEELVAQTLLAMHRMRGTFIRGSSVLPWALAIAERLANER